MARKASRRRFKATGTQMTVGEVAEAAALEASGPNSKASRIRNSPLDHKRPLQTNRSRHATNIAYRTQTTKTTILKHNLARARCTNSSLKVTATFVPMLGLICMMLPTVSIGQTTTTLNPSTSTVDDAISTTPPPPPPTSLNLDASSQELGNNSNSNSNNNNNNNNLQLQLQLQQQHKLKPVNFTLVDEIFNTSLDDVELVRRWKNMDAQFQESIRSILKLVFPQIVAISQDAKVSGDCSGGILKWILSLRNLRSWAIKMLDATGKPTAGIFQGSLTMFGNYRQCLNIRAPDEDEIEITDQFEEYFRGQFCVIHLKPWMPIKKPFYHLNSTVEPLLRKNYKYYEKTLYDELADIAIAFNFIDIRADLCVPSTCTVADIQRVADLLSRKLEMRAKVMRCDTSSRDTDAHVLQQLDQVTIFWSVLPIVLVVLVLIGTFALALGICSYKPSSSEQFNENGRSHLRKCIGNLLECLSIQGILRNRFRAPKIIDTSLMEANNNNHSDLGGHRTTLLIAQSKPLPLYGLRNVFIFWFIIVQMTVELKYQYLRESLVLRNMLLNYWPFQIIINSVLLFDSIILITAFTYSYTNLESTLSELMRYIFDKYLRLVPSIATLVAITILTPLIDIESPVWKNFVKQQADVCKETGYLNLFFLQNFISYEKICLPHTWLFCVELQLICLSIPLVLLIKKAFVDNEDSAVVTQSEKNLDAQYGSQFRCNLVRIVKSKIGCSGLALICLGMTINFVLVYVNELPPAWFYTFPDVDQKNYYFGTYLTKTWVHLTAFFVGLFAGHLVRSTLQLNHLKQLKSILAAPKTRIHNNDDGDNTVVNGFSTGRPSNATPMPGKQDNIGCELVSCQFGLRVVALLSMLTVIFCTYSWSTHEAPSTLVAAAYDSVSRLVWSIGLAAIVIQLCLPTSAHKSSTGSDHQANRLARILSHRVFVQLGRLSFLAYLISPYVHTFVLAVEEQSLFPSLFLIFHVIVGNIVITYSLAFVLSVLIEQPIRLMLAKLTGRTRSTARFFMPSVGAAGAKANIVGQEKLATQNANANANYASNNAAAGRQNNGATTPAAHVRANDSESGSQVPTVVATSH